MVLRNPFIEQVVWEYFQYLKLSDAAATRGSSTLSAFRFAQYILGFDCLREVTVSRRLIGLGEQMFSKKRFLKQALPLTVQQVLKLHSIAKDLNRHPVDRAAAAYFLIATYGRCRHSDLAAVVCVVPDFDDRGGFIEVRTALHKTGRSAASRTQLLPILIPAIGVDGEVWPGAACEAFEGAGLPLFGEVDSPLFRAPKGEGGLFCRRGVTSAEASDLLRALIGVSIEGVEAGAPIVSSHSTKATCLSWAAKYGLTPRDRSILGRHASSTVETYAIYSRDLTVAPCRELQKVCVEISLGRFLPDAPRSEFFPALPPEPPLATTTAVRAATQDNAVIAKEEVVLGMPGADVLDEPIELVSSSSSSSDSEAGLSSDTSAAGEPPPRVKRFRPRLEASERWYVHRKSHILHKFDEKNSMFFDRDYLACGKRLTEAYSLISESSAWNVQCKLCAKKR